MRDVTWDQPPSIFRDITTDIKDMRSSLDKNSLSDIMTCCNKHLLPLVLCPWGESDFIHKCGHVPYDMIVQRYLHKVFINTLTPRQACQNLYSSREDYIRDSNSDYDDLLFNTSWKVLPSISFVSGKGPCVLTCREHDGGTKKLYIHPPRQPHHIIPSHKGDQLCHAVIKPRLIRPMVASKFNITYQMHEQRGSFQGIDTCDITNFGDFSFCSVLLDESESRSIKYRPDINSLLDQLTTDNYLSSATVKAMHERAIGSGPSEEIIKKCLVGATYVSLEDALLLQH